MNRVEVIKRAAEFAHMDPETVSTAVDSVLRVIEEEMSKGGEVCMRNFGVFTARILPASIRKNPATGVLMNIPARLSVTFRPTISLKERLNRGR